MSSSTRARSRSPHQQWPPPQPVSRITVVTTRDYAHGKAAPRDDDSIDLFSKGLADIERRRVMRQNRENTRNSMSDDHRAIKSFDHGHGRRHSDYQRHDAPKHEISQRLPDYNGRYSNYDQPGGSSSAYGDRRHRSNKHEGGRSSWDNHRGGYPNKYAEDNYGNNPVAKLFQQELEYLDGEVQRDRTDPAVGYSCDVCRVSVNSVSVLQTHFAGAKHKKALARRGMSNALDDLVKLPKDERVRKSILRCTLCNVIIQGTELYLHTTSEQHQEMLTSATPKEMLAKMLKSADGETVWYETVDVQEEHEKGQKKYKCILCDVDFPSKQPYELHIQGKKHEKKLRWTNSDGRDPDDGGNNSAQFWCGICSVFCSTANDLDKHFSGRQHAKGLRIKGVSKEVIHDTLPENTKLFPTIPNPPPRALNLVEGNPHNEGTSKPKKGLYGSLPETLSSPYSSFSNDRPSAPQLPVSTPVVARGIATPPTGVDSSTRSFSLSVGSFLRSINGEDPTPKKQSTTFAKNSSTPSSSVVTQLASKKHFTNTNPVVLVQYPAIKRRQYT